MALDLSHSLAFQ